MVVEAENERLLEEVATLSEHHFSVVAVVVVKHPHDRMWYLLLSSVVVVQLVVETPAIGPSRIRAPFATRSYTCSS